MVSPAELFHQDRLVFPVDLILIDGGTKAILENESSSDHHVSYQGRMSGIQHIVQYVGEGFIFDQRVEVVGVLQEAEVRT